MNVPTVQIVVRGRVQGVGFRYFVLRLAQQYGLDGEVWNRRDGGVELIAGHTDASVLSEFERALYEGPGRVSGVTSSPGYLPVQGGFRIGDSR